MSVNLPHLNITAQKQADLNIAAEKQPDLKIEAEKQPDLKIEAEKKEKIKELNEENSLLSELEAAVLEDTGINLVDSTLDRDRITSVKAKFDKDDKGAIIAETYVLKKPVIVKDPKTQTEETLYKEVTYWKIKETFTIMVRGTDGKEIPVKRTGYHHTSIEVPEGVSSPNKFDHSLYLARLQAGMERRVIKMALDPGLTDDYKKMQNNLDYLRKTRIQEIEICPTPHQWSNWQHLKVGEAAMYSIIRMKDNDGRDSSFELTYYRMKRGTIKNELGKDVDRYAHQKYREQKVVCKEDKEKEKWYTDLNDLEKSTPRDFVKKYNDYKIKKQNDAKYRHISGRIYQERVKNQMEEKKWEFEKTAEALSIAFAGGLGMQLLESATGWVRKKQIAENVQKNVGAFIDSHNAYKIANRTNDPNTARLLDEANQKARELSDWLEHAQNLKEIKDEFANKRDQLNKLKDADPVDVDEDEMNALEKKVNELEEVVESFLPLVDIGKDINSVKRIWESQRQQAAQQPLGTKGP